MLFFALIELRKSGNLKNLTLFRAKLIFKLYFSLKLYLHIFYKILKFQKPFILKRSQSMTDFTNGYQEMKYMHSEQNDKSINTGINFGETFSYIEY